MSVVADNLVGQNLKQRYVPMFMHMNADDKKLIKRWRVDDEGSVTKVKFYMALVGQGFIEFVTAQTDKAGGAFRLYPEDMLVCVELSFPKGRA